MNTGFQANVIALTTSDLYLRVSSDPDTVTTLGKTYAVNAPLPVALVIHFALHIPLRSSFVTLCGLPITFKAT